MLERLLTEQAHPDSTHLDELSILQLVTLMNDADRWVAEAVGREADRIARAAEAAGRALELSGHLIYAGAGTSGRLGVLDAAECPPTLHTPPELVQAIIAGGDRALRRSVEAA